MAWYQTSDKPLSKSLLSGWMNTAHAYKNVLYSMKHAQGFVVFVCFLLFLMTSSNGNIFRVTGPFCGEFTGPGEFPTQRPVTRSFDVFFDLRLNKRLSKQPWCWWFETPSWSLLRQCNVYHKFLANSHESRTDIRRGCPGENARLTQLQGKDWQSVV